MGMRLDFISGQLLDNNKSIIQYPSVNHGTPVPQYIMQVSYLALLTIQHIDSYHIRREFCTITLSTNHLSYYKKKIDKNVWFTNNTSWHARWWLVRVEALLWVFTGRGRVTRVFCSLEWGIGTLALSGKFCIFISVCWGGDACVCVWGEGGWGLGQTGGMHVCVSVRGRGREVNWHSSKGMH